MRLQIHGEKVVLHHLQQLAIVGRAALAIEDDAAIATAAASAPSPHAAAYISGPIRQVHKQTQARNASYTPASLPPPPTLSSSHGASSGGGGSGINGISGSGTSGGSGGGGSMGPLSQSSIVSLAGAMLRGMRRGSGGGGGSSNGGGGSSNGGGNSGSHATNGR